MWNGLSEHISLEDGVEFYIRRRWEPGCYGSWMCGYVRLPDELVDKFEHSSVVSKHDMECLGISYGINIGERHTGKWIHDKYGLYPETVRYMYLALSRRNSSDMPNEGYWIGFHIGSADQDLGYKCASYKETVARCEKLIKIFSKLVNAQTREDVLNVLYEK